MARLTPSKKDSFDLMITVLRAVFLKVSAIKCNANANALMEVCNWSWFEMKIGWKVGEVYFLRVGLAVGWGEDFHCKFQGCYSLPWSDMDFNACAWSFWLVWPVSPASLWSIRCFQCRIASWISAKTFKTSLISVCSCTLDVLESTFEDVFSIHCSFDSFQFRARSSIVERYRGSIWGGKELTNQV